MDTIERWGISTARSVLSSPKMTRAGNEECKCQQRMHHQPLLLRKTKTCKIWNQEIEEKKFSLRSSSALCGHRAEQFQYIWSNQLYFTLSVGRKNILIFHCLLFQYIWSNKLYFTSVGDYFHSLLLTISRESKTFDI